MSLNDKVAQQIMGEIDTLTKRIDGQVALLANSTREVNNASTRINDAVQKARAEAMAATEKLMAATALQEMQKAGDATLKALSVEVGRIAQRLARDTAAAEKAHAISFAAKWAAAGVIGCAVVFGGVGYGLRLLTDEVNLSIARKAVVAADTRAADAEKQALNEVEAVKKSIGWMGTKEGQIAKRFFEYPNNIAVVTCTSPTLDIVQGPDSKWCIPKRRDLFGGDENKYGWQIP